MPGQIMGVLNVTPDSFSDGGSRLDPAVAIDYGRRLFAEGAAIVDVGGESTRPGASAVSTIEELARVIPVVEGLARHGRVSIDTRNATVALRAVEAGATMINDVSASLHHVAAESGVAWVAMHMRGEPATMQASPHYDDVVREVAAFLAARADLARTVGVSEVWIDPGIGFGKSLEHNIALIAQLHVLTEGDYPVLVGTSRKNFLGLLSGEAEAPPPTDRLEGSLTSAVMAVQRGAAMVRVHDVRSTARALRMLDAVDSADVEPTGFGKVVA